MGGRRSLQLRVRETAGNITRGQTCRDRRRGTDVSWLIGTVVAGTVYYALMQRYPRRHGFLLVPEDDVVPVGQSQAAPVEPTAVRAVGE